MKVPFERFAEDFCYTLHVVEATYIAHTLYYTVPSPMFLSLVIVEESQLGPAVAEKRVGEPGMVQVMNHG